MHEERKLLMNMMPLPNLELKLLENMNMKVLKSLKPTKFMENVSMSNT